MLALRAEEIHSRPFEVGIAAATAFGVVGSSVGFILKWGPIAWGLISAAAGFAIGFGSVCLARKMKGKRAITRSPLRPLPEIALIVQCCETKYADVRHVLWQYRAISVGDAVGPAST